jgi:hypothetical protein
MPDVLRGLRCAVRACGLISLEVGMIVCVDVDRLPTLLNWVKLKRFNIGVYVHQAAKDKTVWYDDVALSTGYVGLVTP